MVNEDVLLACSMVLRQFLDVMAEHPDTTSMEFRAMVIDADAEVTRLRNESFMNISRGAQAVLEEEDPERLLLPDHGKLP